MPLQQQQVFIFKSKGKNVIRVFQGVKFLLLVDNVKNEESIKNFFIDVYELLVKV